MRSLTNAVADYLALRRGLGFKLLQAEWLLPSFLAFLREQRSSVVSTRLAVLWAQRPPNTNPDWHSKKLETVRGFARYRSAFDPRTEIPPVGLLHRRRRRPTPRLYAEDEVVLLMRHARRLATELQAATHATLIGLLASTGMRVGEAIALKDRDVDSDSGLIMIRSGKLGKSRTIPVHASTLRALRAYGKLRDRLCPQRRDETLFVSRAGTRLIYTNVCRTMGQILRSANVSERGGSRPHINGLRHSFAVNTVVDWYKAGADVEQRMLVLSTYLGHVKPSSTYWYLTATPELLAVAGKRRDRVREVRS